MVNAGHLRVAERWGDIIDMPITAEEIKTVVHRGAGNKEPGHDGKGVEFFKKNCSTIKDIMTIMFNHMYSTGNIREQQKNGIVVCIPMRPILAELLHPS
jgi:hypothetical protein